MSGMKIEKGKWYKVKTWKQMEKEFGVDEAGGINFPLSFPPAMEEEVSEQPNRMIKIEKRDSDGDGVWKGWYIFPEMLVSVEEDSRDIQRRLKKEA